MNILNFFLNKYIFIATLTSVLANLSLASVSLERKGSRLIIAAKECKELLPTINAIQDFSKAIQERSFEQAQLITTNENCQADVSNLFPAFVRDPILVKIGPICFSLPLFVQKIIPRIFPVFDREFDFWLNSPLCRKLTETDSLQSGDIGVVGLKSNRRDHTFTYISREFSLETDAINLWHASSVDLIYADYGIDVNCTTRFSTEGNPCNSKNQDDKISFYRCTSLEKSRYKYLFSYVPREAFEIEQKITFIEQGIEKDSLDMRKKEIDQVVRDALLQRDSFLQNQEETTESDKQYWLYLSYRIERILMMTRWQL